MSINFDEYDQIFTSFNNNNNNANTNNPNNGNGKQQQQENNGEINMNNAYFDPMLSMNMNQYDMGAMQNYQNEKLSTSTYDSISPPTYSTDSSPEAILFGTDNFYRQDQQNQQQQQQQYNGMDVDNILASNNFNFNNGEFDSTAANNVQQNNNNNNGNGNTLFVDSSSPDSFQSSPASITTFQPNNANNNNDNNSNNIMTANTSAVTTAPGSTTSEPAIKPKGKRGRKPNQVKLEELALRSDSISPPTMPPVLTKTLSSTSGSGAGITKPGKKVKCSHNLIEKKYRTNINSKIIELRNCVPSLRILISKNHSLHSSNNEDEIQAQKQSLGEFEDDYEGEGYSDDERKLDGLKPARKLNKATILSKATEYIRHLETKLEILNNENEKLREIAINSGNNEVPMLSSSSHINNDNTNPHHQHHQQHSPQSMTNSPPTASSSSSQQQQNPSSSLTNNLIMGGLTCLVGASTLDDFDSSNSNFRRGLFSVPILSFNSNQSVSVMLKPILGLFKIFFVFGVVMYMIEPLFRSSSSPDKKKQQTSSSSTVFEIEWVSILKNLQYLTSPSAFFNDVIKIKEIEAYQPLLVSSSDLQLQTLCINLIRMMMSTSTGDEVKFSLLKSLYLRFIADKLSSSSSFGLKDLVVKLAQYYWNKSATAIDQDYKDLNVIELVHKNSDVITKDVVFEKYTQILEQQQGESIDESDEVYSTLATPFAILSNLIVEFQFKETLKLIIELETLKQEENTNESELTKQQDTIDNLLSSSISLSKTITNVTNSQLLVLQSLMSPSMVKLDEALLACKQDQYQQNPNGLICGLIKLQLLNNNTQENEELDKSKLLLLFKKLKLDQMDLISFTSLYSIINIFPRDLLIEAERPDQDQDQDQEENASISSDSSIEYTQNHSVEYKLNQLILSILGNLRIFLGKQDNQKDVVELDNGLKSILIDNFVNEINVLDC